MDIEEVVSDFVSLKRKGSGKYLWACCPFHDEKTPSFAVTPDKGIYKCFGCGASGDSISFIMDHDGLSYIEAIRYLATKFGVEVKETDQTDEAQEARNDRESLYIVLNHANEYFRKNLIATEEGKSIGMSYLRERGIDQRHIDKFELGFSLSTWDDLYHEATAKAYQEDILEKAGLVIRKDEEKVYDRFRGRVMFPIHNISGKVVAFGARTLKKNEKPKYLNSPESDVYSKSRILYGIFQAKNAIRKHDNCYLTEGYTDVISLHMSGIEHVVASSGTSLTEEQIKLISRFSQNITVLYDGDPAGIKASIRGIDMILQAGMNVRTVVFPTGEDPDSYSQKLGSTAFREYLAENTKDFITFKVGLYAEEAAKDPLKKAESISEIIRSISLIPDGVKRAVYIRESSRLLDIDEQVLVSELNKYLLRIRKANSSPERMKERPEPMAEDVLPQPGITNNDIIGVREWESLRIMIKHGTREHNGEPLYRYLLSEFSDVRFISEHSQVLDWYRIQVEDGIVPDSATLLKNADEEIRGVLVDLITDKYEVSPYWFEKHQIYVPNEEDNLEKLFVDNVTRLKHSIVRKMIDEHREKLKDTRDDEEIHTLLEVQMKLKEVEMELARHLGVVIPTKGTGNS